MKPQDSSLRATPTPARSERPPEGAEPGALAASFEDFYELEHGRLFGALILVTRHRQESEEVMQEAFLKVWERWSVVQGLTNPTGYLYRTAMNVFLSRRRRAAVAARRLGRRALGADPLEAIEVRDQVDRALEKLTPRQRTALVLTDLLEFPPSEVAQAMRVSPSTARVLLARAREVMRREFDSNE
jgi:RNA polymerase sigma-70 factor (ECF subfamily)